MSTQTSSGITDRNLGFLGFVVLCLCFFSVMCAWDKGGDAVREELHDRSARTEHLLQAYAACRTPERDTFDDHAACLAFARCVVDGGPACEEVTP